MSEQEQALVQAEEKGLVVGYGEDAADGFQDTTPDDYARPFIRILDDNSPQVKESSGKSIPGAKAGMFFNNVTMDVYDGREQGITIIPCHRQREYIEWKPRDEGGGLVDVHRPDSAFVKASLETKMQNEGTVFGKVPTPEGNELAETFNLMCLVVDEWGGYFEAILSFTSTQIPKYRGLMTKSRQIRAPQPDGSVVNPPLYGHKYRVKTIGESNATYSWWGYHITFDGKNAEEARIYPGDELYDHAKTFAKYCQSGKLQMNREIKRDDAEQAPVSDDDVPF